MGGEDLCEHYKEMSMAAEVREPTESRKAKAIWKMKAANEERKDNIFGKNYNATGTVGRAPQRPTCGTGQSLEVPGKAVLLMIGGQGRFKLVKGCFAVM